MLRQRLVGAALYLPLLLVLLWLNWLLRMRGNADDLPLLAVVLIIATACGWEVSHVVRKRRPRASPWNGVYAALILPFLVHAIRPGHDAAGHLTAVGSPGLLVDSLGATTAVMLLFLAVWSDIEQRGREGLVENLAAAAAGLYIGTSMSAIVLLGGSTLHEAGVLFVFLVVFALDTAAYFGGKLFNGPRLAPRVSPNKTLGGAGCGLLAAVALALLLKASAPLLGAEASWGSLGAHLGWGQLAIVGLAIGVLGQVGDLLESAFKRWGAVKDAGVAIPGHGGFLDRFDSLLLAAPAAYLLLALFLKLPRGW